MLFSPSISTSSSSLLKDNCTALCTLISSLVSCRGSDERGALERAGAGVSFQLLSMQYPIQLTNFYSICGVSENSENKIEFENSRQEDGNICEDCT